MVAWQFAMNLPQMTEGLIVLNLPHPNGLLRELKSSPEQIRNSEYARTFQRQSPKDPAVFFGRPMTAETLSGWVKDPAAPPCPKVKAPVLMFHGLNDQALHSDGLAGTWNWVEKDLTLVTVPGASHFVRQDAPDLVTSTMRWWLAMRAR